jgi:hypothetical protein
MEHNYEQALKLYARLGKSAKEFGYPWVKFHSTVSEIVTSWELGLEVSSESIQYIQKLLGMAADWEGEVESKQMRDVRARLYEDTAMESDLCVLYDREKNFECRFERQSPRKGCFGNIFWQASVCPHLIEFLQKLEE